MSLEDIADFAAPLDGSGQPVFAAFAAPGRHILLPEGLEIASRADGHPAFSLRLVRGENTAGAEPYGVLDLEVEPHLELEKALADVRRVNPAGTVAPARLSGGSLNLLVDADFSKAAGALVAPAPLLWMGPARARWILRLPPGEVVFLRDALASSALLVRATAEFDIVGVSPRVPLVVHFDPAELVKALAALAKQGSAITRDEVVGFFNRRPELLPVRIEGALEPAMMGAFAEAMADRVRVRFGMPLGDGALDGLPHGTFTWDLAEAATAPRAFRLALDPLESARALVQAVGIDAVVTEVTVPPLGLGMWRVEVRGNVPAARRGVLALGATLRVPARPPHRPAALERSVELDPPGDKAEVLLRLSPGEALDYTIQTYAVLSSGRGGIQVESCEMRRSDLVIDLTTADFPVRFITVSSAADVLALASVTCTCRYSLQETEASASFELTVSAPLAAFAVPKASPATLTIEAVAHNGSGTIRLGPMPAESQHLVLPRFREYGPHTIDISCPLPEGAPLMAIDLLPEGLPESASEALHFTPSQPAKKWTYFASSPFQASYRFRRRATNDPWVLRSPFEPLVIEPG